MKKVRVRVMALLIPVLLLAIGLGIFLFRLIRDGNDWVMFRSNGSIYDDGVLAVGTVTDRNGVVLASTEDGERVYSDDEELRRATLHVVGDPYGNIGTGALSAFADALAGYDLVGGTYSVIGSGDTVALSVDGELNRVAYEALDGRNGAVAVCDYKTGEILCCVSCPTYDPDDPPDDFDDPEYDGVFLNRVLSASYTPGSIYKLVTVTAALEQLPNVRERTFFCSGSLDVDDGTVVCTGWHGEQTLEEALANSCNCAFAELALELGPETLAAYAERLGLTREMTVSGITTATGTFEKAKPGSEDLAWSGIGQYHDTVTPIQMLRLMCAVANGGHSPELTLLRNGGMISGSGGDTLLRSDTAREIGEMMSYNVAATYGRDNFPGLELHAKSGTAEVGEDASSHAWFVGYIDDPEHPLAFVVLVENGGWGGSVAGSVANTVLQAAVSSNR